MKKWAMRFLLVSLALGLAVVPLAAQRDRGRGRGPAKNVILFVGDGMGVSTVTAARAFSVGIDGRLVIDQFPYTALSRVYSTDFITPDSAATMTAMMTGVNTNSGVIGYPPTTELGDFNGDGDGEPVTTLLELAEAAGMMTGVVTTARVTHATPAATFAHINHRDKEDDIAVQALSSGIDVLLGGGRRHFNARTDGNDLVGDFQAAGYQYVSDQTGLNVLGTWSLPVLGLFSSSHMAYEHDRPGTNQPSLSQMTAKAVELLEGATQSWWRPQAGNGYFLMVESGRIDHAHHETNAYRALSETEEFDRAIWEAIVRVDLRDTLILVTADHSHVFTIGGYPLVPHERLPYQPVSTLDEYISSPYNNILDVVFDINEAGEVFVATDADGTPYTALSYANGGGHRGPGPRVDPRLDAFPGHNGAPPAGPNDPEYMQEALVPFGFGGETHSAEEVAIYAVGPGAEWVRGTVKNAYIFAVMRAALGL